MSSPIQNAKKYLEQQNVPINEIRQYISTHFTETLFRTAGIYAMLNHPYSFGFGVAAGTGERVLRHKSQFSEPGSVKTYEDLYSRFKKVIDKNKVFTSIFFTVFFVMIMQHPYLSIGLALATGAIIANHNYLEAAKLVKVKKAE